MKVKIEIPDNIGEFLKAVASQRRKDAKAYIKGYIEYWIVDVLSTNIDAVGDMAPFDCEELVERYGLEETFEAVRLHGEKGEL